VLKIDGEEIQDGTQLRTAIGRHVAGEKITLTLRRDDEELEIQVTLGERPQG
jgi:S1-C subfamily serine protease